MNFVLIGFKNSGKTHFGRLLAKELHLPFIDTDELLMLLSGASSCREFYQQVGEKAFRSIEKEALKSLHGVEKSVIATGGGSVYHDEVDRLGKIVYLEAQLELLKERDLPDWIEKLFDERKPLYEKKAHYKVVIEGKNEAQILNELKEIYGK